MNADVVVIGGGHAGCEAALASARLGLKTLLVTLNLDSIGHMACNPSVGGVGKGQLVKEIDALGGMMGLAADNCAIQFRMLNSSKGPAVQSPRAQVDRWEYASWVKAYLEQQNNLQIIQEQVVDLLVENKRVLGVITEHGLIINCKAVVICTGTFSKGRLYLGPKKTFGGRVGEVAQDNLTDALTNLGLKLFRMRTDTCPRIDARTVDFSKLKIEHGDINPKYFSSRTQSFEHKQVACYSAWTSEKTFLIVNSILDQAPAITGELAGNAPRYCPNFESKVARFPDKKIQHLFLEPEGRNTQEMYISGFSTSIPIEYQEKMVQSVVGLEEARILRYGYAVEYSVIESTSLKNTLEHKDFIGLYFAGQVNGTSGYEEAAAQGLIAGANAALKIMNYPALCIGRDQGYIGVLIDDITTRATNEPYRLFTSRAEYRLLLRQDNADIRLLELIQNFKLNTPNFLQQTKDLIEEIKYTQKLLDSNFTKEGISLAQFLRRPDTNFADLIVFLPELDSCSSRAREQLEIENRYSGYIKRHQNQIKQLERLRNRVIPCSVDYNQVSGISREAREKLSLIKPETLAQARQISGVSPADVLLLSLYLEKLKV